MGWTVSSDAYSSDRSEVDFLAAEGLPSGLGRPEEPDFGVYLLVVGA